MDLGFETGPTLEENGESIIVTDAVPSVWGFCLVSFLEVSPPCCALPCHSLGWNKTAQAEPESIVGFRL